MASNATQDDVGRVAIVKITTPQNNTVLAIEVAFNGETLTIDRDGKPITRAIARKTRALIEEVRKEYGYRTTN